MAACETAVSILCGDVMAKVLSFLSWRDVMSCRYVATSWRDGVSQAPIEGEFHIQTAALARNLGKAADCFPNLQALRIDQAAAEFLDDDCRFAKTVSRWQSLKHLRCLYMANLKSSFRELRSLSHLVSLDLYCSERLEWQLSDLSSMPFLKRVICVNNYELRGDTKQLIDLPLEAVDLSGCLKVTGNLIDFARLPRLHTLFLDRTQVKGDVRHIRIGDFPAMRLCGLAEGIYGSSKLKFVSHAPSVMNGRHLLSQKSNEDCPIYPFRVSLSQDSTDYHERAEQRLYSSERDPPFNVELVEAGPRRGWRWSNYLGGYCEVHWLDPEPQSSDDRYEQYLESASNIRMAATGNLFHGFMEPPTQNEYTYLSIVAR